MKKTNFKKDFEEVEVEPKGKKVVATKTISIIAGKKQYNLIEGQEIPSDISSKTAESLKNSNLIK